MDSRERSPQEDRPGDAEAPAEAPLEDPVQASPRPAALDGSSASDRADDGEDDRDDSVYTDPDRNWVNQELELLISAAIVFTLFQLPGLLDGWFQRAEAHLGNDLQLLVFMPYYFAKLVVYGLIATFLLHFLMRSFWVSLLGLRTAYPDGIRWDRLKLGPLTYERLHGRLPSLPELEARVDRMASSLFAFLFVFLISMAMGLSIASLLFLIGLGIGRLVHPEDPMKVGFQVFTGVMLGFTVLAMLAGLVDRTLRGDKAHRVPGWLATAAGKMIGISSAGPLNRAYLPIFFTLSSSRVSRNKLNVILIAFVYSLIGVFMVGMAFDSGILKVDSYAYYPDQADQRGMSPRHYDSLRAEGSSARLPSLSSDLASGPYLRLFLPYDVAEDNPRIAALCPDLEPLHGEGLRKRRREAPEEDRLDAILACLGSLYEVELDDRPLADIDWTFFTHPDGDVPGWLTYLPTADLDPGRHLLVVRHRPLPEEARDEDGEDKSADEHFLPFWK